MHWSSSRPSWGQILKLDPRRRVKFPMAQVGQEPVIDLSSSYIVEPSIDCQVRKARNERQEVPQQAWDLRTMWLTGLSYGKVPLASMCAICNRSDNLVSCALCRMTVHLQCSLAAAWHRSEPMRPVVAESHLFAPRVQRTELVHWIDPTTGDLGLCHVCQRFASFGSG